MKRPIPVETAGATTPPADKDVVELSPFQVVADTKGYYSANTMSGTRFNTKLEDLASSITVMTPSLRPKSGGKSVAGATPVL